MHSILLKVHLIWSIFSSCVLGAWCVTLTTAVHRDDHVSVMPTTLYRRIAVDRDAERPQVLPDIFHRTGTMRRNRVDIWNWDYWCQLQPQKGNCSTPRVKYFYNAQLDQCQSFTYSGCHGNKNNFDSMINCQRYCKGATYMALSHIQRTTACSLQPSIGLCIAVFDKYYYDVNDGTCKVFVYSGCGGNQNRFGTKLKCLQKCRQNEGFVEDKLKALFIPNFTNIHPAV